MRVRDPYIFLGVLGTKIFEGKVMPYKIVHKNKVLEDSDGFPDNGFARSWQYCFRKFRVHFWLGHDGCHDELVERKIGALLLLGPSVLSFVVVTR